MAADPLYEAWVWLVKEKDGVEGMISVLLPNNPMPWILHTRRKDIAVGPMKQMAHQHAKVTGLSVRLAHLREVRLEKVSDDIGV